MAKKTKKMDVDKTRKLVNALNSAIGSRNFSKANKILEELDEDVGAVYGGGEFPKSVLEGYLLIYSNIQRYLEKVMEVLTHRRKPKFDYSGEHKNALRVLCRLVKMFNLIYITTGALYELNREKEIKAINPDFQIIKWSLINSAVMLQKNILDGIYKQDYDPRVSPRASHTATVQIYDEFCKDYPHFSPREYEKYPDYRCYKKKK